MFPPVGRCARAHGTPPFAPASVAWSMFAEVLIGRTSCRKKP